MSQSQFAAACRAAGNAVGEPNQCTKRLVQKWETGEHTVCRPRYLRVLQVVTGLTARELGFRLPTERVVQLTEAPRTTAQGALGEPSQFGGAAGRVAAFGFSGKVGRSSDEMVEESLERLHHALNHPSTVDAHAADFVETATSRLFDLEHHSPARLLAPTVDRHLDLVTSLLAVTRHEAVRRRLMVSSGTTALLAAWLAFDRGDAPSADRFWEASIGAAEGARNANLLGAGLTCQSYAALRNGDPRAAWQLAHAASEHVAFGDSRAASWVMARVALYAAQLGERKPAEEAMHCSLELGGSLPCPQPGDGGLPWTRTFDTARLMSAAAHTAALLDDPTAIDYATKAVDALSPTKVKARAVVLAEAALTAAVAGEYELCLDWGSAAATLASELNASVAVDLLHEVIPVVLPNSHTRAIRELLPHLSRLTRTTDGRTE